MTQYIIDAADPATESTWLAYKNAQHDVRDQVGVAYRAVTVALSMYAQMAARLQKGDLSTVAEYHVAKSAGLLKQELTLIDHLKAAMALIEEMQAALPDEELFPGVPKTKSVSVDAGIEPAAFAVLR